jgi:hypothetical protein
MNLFGEEVIENPFENAKTYEKHLETLLKEQKYFVVSQKYIGEKPTGGKHIVDCLVNGKIIVSAKLQNVGGTAEEKIPYEQLMLQYACNRGYEKAYIVCAGTGWTILNYFTSQEYAELINTKNVSVIKHNDFLKIIHTL